MNLQDSTQQNITAWSALGAIGSLALACCAVMLTFALAFSHAI